MKTPTGSPHFLLSLQYASAFPTQESPTARARQMVASRSSSCPQEAGLPLVGWGVCSAVLCSLPGSRAHSKSQSGSEKAGVQVAQ